MTSTSVFLMFLIGFKTISSISCFTTNIKTGLREKSSFRPVWLTTLHAKKSRKKKGFGKALPPPEKTSTVKEELDTSPSLTASSYTPLESIEDSNIKDLSKEVSSIDPSLPVEERNKQILRERYGLTSIEERKAERNAAKQKKRVEQLVQDAKENPDFDLFDVLPGPVITFFDLFLKGGLAVSTLLFVASGIGISIEAWSKASGSVLPENVDEFIVNVIEPNFTPGLGVLLGFSISLGVFSLGQLGSKSTQYRE